MVKNFEKYLRKHPPFTSFEVKNMHQAKVVVVIPVYLENNLSQTLNSLVNTDNVNEKIAVVVVINASDQATVEEIQHQNKTINDLDQYQYKKSGFQIYTIKAFGLPQKHFGAGLARKIGMDAAVSHFSQTNNEDGIIVSLDADSEVQPNYFSQILKFFSLPKNNACSIYFEHPIEGVDFEDKIYEAITQYELHLRYYVECLRFVGFPYAVHTIGSCFALKASSYVGVGGMNRRQGGEEFYFIQKLLQQDGYGEINNTTVYPSPRISSRVPFGTGPTIKKMIESGQDDYMTYNLQCFVDLKHLLQSIEKYYKITEEAYQNEILNLPGRVRSFLLNTNFFQELKPIIDNCSTLGTFKKRFFHVFNAFKLVKYVNYTHEHFLEKSEIYDAAIELLEIKGLNIDEIFDEKELLIKYRKIQKQHSI